MTATIGKNNPEYTFFSLSLPLSLIFHTSLLPLLTIVDSNTNKQATLTIAITTNLEAQLSTPTLFPWTRSIPETLGAPDGCTGCREREKGTEEVVGVFGKSADLFSSFL